MNQTDQIVSAKQELTHLFLEEFSNTNYDGVSISKVCKEHHISKGQLYHHFKSKDEIYLYCINYTYQTLIQYLTENYHITHHFNDDIKHFIFVRTHFGVDFPILNKLFLNSLVNVPEHLDERITQQKNELVNFNKQTLLSLLSDAPIIDGLSKQDAIDYYLFVIDAFNFELSKLETLEMEYYNRKLSKTLQMMLYGTIKREDQ